MFDDIDFDDDEYGVSDKLNKWEDFSYMFWRRFMGLFRLDWIK